MPAPYDYTIGEIASPQQSFLQGIQMVDALRKREQDMAEAQAAKQKQQELQALYAEAMKPDAKPDVFERLSFAIDPQKAALAKFQQRTDAQQAAMISNVGSVWAPLLTGNPELAMKNADMLIAATENSPNVDQKSLQSLKAARQALGQSPELAQVSLATTLMSFGDKGRKFVTDTFEALKKPVEQRKAAAEAGEAEAKLDEANIKLKRLDALQEAELRKATSAADEQAIRAKYAERIQNADLALKNAQRNREEAQTTSLKADADKGPTPVFNAQAGGFVVSPTKANPKGGFIPLNAIADNQQQQSAVKALKTAGYDPITGEDRISKLIEKSTGGVAQAITTDVIRAFGFTTEGRKAINDLETSANAISLELLGGKLGAGTSNSDVQFILGQLGDVANPNKPAEERLAGWTAAKNRMITSGILPPPTGSKQPSKESTPSAQPSNYQNMSDAELMKLLGR
jgi:hypothetical protein